MLESLPAAKNIIKFIGIYMVVSTITINFVTKCVCATLAENRMPGWEKDRGAFHFIIVCHLCTAKVGFGLKACLYGIVFYFATPVP